jgi:hypothetical protein
MDMATCLKNVNVGLRVKKLEHYPSGGDLIAVTFIENTKMLLESRKCVKVAHDLDVVGTHDYRERDEHRPEGASSVDLHGFPISYLMLSRSASLGHVSIYLIELPFGRCFATLLLRVQIGGGVLNHRGFCGFLHL